MKTSYISIVLCVSSFLKTIGYIWELIKDTEHCSRLFLCAQWADGRWGSECWVDQSGCSVTHTASFFFSLSFSLQHNRWVSPQPCSIIKEAGGCWVTNLSLEEIGGRVWTICCSGIWVTLFALFNVTFLFLVGLLI